MEEMIFGCSSTGVRRVGSDGTSRKMPVRIMIIPPLVIAHTVTCVLTAIYKTVDPLCPNYNI
jgi:hypothetical protein